MHQIDNSTALDTLPTAKPVGPNPGGFFSSGDKDTLVLPTRLDNDWLNMVMMEIINVLVEADITPDKSDRNQLYKAIYKIIFGVLPAGGGGVITNPFASDTEVLEIFNGSGDNARFYAEGSNGVAYGIGNVAITANNVIINGSLEVNDFGGPVNAIVNSIASISDTAVATQQASKTYIDSFFSSVAKQYRSSILTGYSSAPIVAGTTMYVARGAPTATGLLGYAVTNLQAGTLKNLSVSFEASGAVDCTITVMDSGFDTGIVLNLTTTQGVNNIDTYVVASSSIQLKVDVDGASADIENLVWSLYLEKDI